jgi:hypothetical protein
VDNEGDVLKVLGEAGYTAVDPSVLPWREQLLMFMLAEEVFGSFGSHMLSCQFMQPLARLGIAFPTGLALNYQSYIPLFFGVAVSRINASRTVSRDIDSHLNSDIAIDLKGLRGFLVEKLPALPVFNL